MFIDASCVPGPDWLEQLCAPIGAGEETTWRADIGRRPGRRIAIWPPIGSRAVAI